MGNWKMAFFQYPPKNSASIIAALVGTLGVIVVHPCVHDYLARRVIPEEQPVLLKKFRAGTSAYAPRRGYSPGGIMLSGYNAVRH